MQRTGSVPLLRHPYLLHLRLGFNLLLSPVYLWGVLLAGGGLGSADFWLGYLSLHLFLYGGTTAFNSYYDRDEGPIGGMLRPPPVDEGLLRFSLLVQALGLLPAALVGIPFLAAWLLLFLVFAAYSHPLVRLKARPLAALAAISLGQGAVGFALGWLAVRPAGLLGAPALLGMTSTALIVTGLYLVTQSYQVDEDRRRGDRTLAVLLGARNSLRLALLPLAAGGGILLGWTWAVLAPAAAVPLALFFAAVAVSLWRWSSRIDGATVEENFRMAMRLTAGASLGLSLYLLLALAFGGAVS